MDWRFGLAVAVVTGVVGWADEARACSPWDPHLDRAYPAHGEVLPAGADLLLDGQVLSPDNLTATIDGMPVELVVVEERSIQVYYAAWDLAYRTLALRFDAEPGQTIEITGDPCLQYDGSSFCDPVTLTFTVGEPDVVQPHGPVDLWYGVYDNEQAASFDTTCGTTGEVRYEVTAVAEIEEPLSEYPLEYQLLRRPRDAPEAWVPVEHDWLVDADDHDDQLWFSLLMSETEAADLLPLAEAFCFRFELRDPTGNLTDALEVCSPCYEQTGDDEAGLLPWPAGPPHYDDAWLYPGGHCPQAVSGTTGGQGETGGTGDEPGSGGSTTGDVATGDEAPGTDASTDPSTGQASADPAAPDGCACRTEPEPGKRLWLVVLAAGLAFTARRRRQPQP